MGITNGPLFDGRKRRAIRFGAQPPIRIPRNRVTPHNPGPTRHPNEPSARPHLVSASFLPPLPLPASPIQPEPTNQPPLRRARPMPPPPSPPPTPSA
ncbi:hypothetical protein EJB05_57476, partial [Eragrostis curvula]